MIALRSRWCRWEWARWRDHGQQLVKAMPSRQKIIDAPLFLLEFFGPLHAGRDGLAIPEKPPQGIERRLDSRFGSEITIIRHVHQTAIEGHVLPVGQDHLAAKLIRAFETPDTTHEGNRTCPTRRQGIGFANTLSDPQWLRRIPQQRLHTGVNIECDPPSFDRLILVDLAI